MLNVTVSSSILFTKMGVHSAIPNGKSNLTIAVRNLEIKCKAPVCGGRIGQ